MFGKCHAGAIGMLCTLAMTACGGGGAARSQPPSIAGGQAPTLDASEIDAVVAYLCTPTDGYDHKNPAPNPVPGQCLSRAP